MGGWGGDDDDEPTEAERIEAANGLRQAHYLDAEIRRCLDAGERARVTPELLRRLNVLAVEGLIPSAGAFRVRDDQEITNSAHVPPPAAQIAGLVDELCLALDAPPRTRGRRVRTRARAERLAIGRAVGAAAFVLWRVNWIHPFDDGNGRTARAAAHLVLCTRLGFVPPGSPALPTRIRWAQIRYWRALSTADAAWARGRLDVTDLFNLLVDLLTQASDASAPPPNARRRRR